MTHILRILARQGRFTLAAGLIAGLLLPSVATAMKPWLAHIVVLLLFLTSLRIGPRDALRGLRGYRATLKLVIVLQLIVPLLALAGFAALGVLHTPYALAVVLVLVAPALTGSPNLAILLGADPEPAFRFLILGTAILPLTMLPVFVLLPQFGDLTQALAGALRLLGAIGFAVITGFALRGYFSPTLRDEKLEIIDGLMTLTLVIIVIGLMGALGPALINAPCQAFIWLCVAGTVTIGMQVITFLVLRKTKNSQNAVPFSIVAGSRNVALFLVTMSAEQAEPLLLFLGCYQIPMYLTPILMRPLYRWGAQKVPN